MGLHLECQVCHSGYKETPKHRLWDCSGIVVVSELVNKVCRHYAGVRLFSMWMEAHRGRG